MKSNRYDLLILAMLVATLAIGGLFVLYRHHELLHDAPPMELRVDPAKNVTPSPAKTTVVLPQPEHAAVPEAAKEPAESAPMNVPPMNVAPMNVAPMNVALVTADWCGACQSFKRDVMPLLRERLDEKQIAFREVDLDRQADEARALLADAEQSIPQLVVFQCAEKNGSDPAPARRCSR